MVKRHRKPKLTDAEHKIMQVIWGAGQATISQVHREISKRRRDPLSRSTVQVQLRRLEEKGWIRHVQRGRSYFYQATVTQQQNSATVVREIQQRVFGGSCTELVKSLYDANGITKQDLAELRQLLDLYDTEGD